MGTSWDAGTYDRSSAPQQSWAGDVLARLEGIAPDATVLDVGCGTGRVTEALLGLVPRGRVLAFDASEEMVELARARLGDAPRCGARTSTTSTSPSPSTPSSPTRSCTGCPTTTGCGRRSPARCGRAAGW